MPNGAFAATTPRGSVLGASPANWRTDNRPGSLDAESRGGARLCRPTLPGRGSTAQPRCSAGSNIRARAVPHTEIGAIRDDALGNRGGLHALHRHVGLLSECSSTPTRCPTQGRNGRPAERLANRLASLAAMAIQERERRFRLSVAEPTAAPSGRRERPPRTCQRDRERSARRRS